MIKNFLNLLIAPFFVIKVKTIVTIIKIFYELKIVTDHSQRKFFSYKEDKA